GQCVERPAGRRRARGSRRARAPQTRRPVPTRASGGERYRAADRRTRPLQRPRRARAVLRSRALAHRELDALRPLAHESRARLARRSGRRMSSLTEAELAAALAERGVLTEKREAPEGAANDRPWFVSAVLGGAGWLAGVFVLFFVYLLFEPDSAPELGVAGAVLLAAAYALYRADRRGAFFTQLALALSIAGQISLCGAFGAATESVAATAAITA